MGQGRTKHDDGSFGWTDWELETWSKLKFVGTPGHESIVGNECADRKAKRAALGHTSDTPDLLR